ncbi:hypothetical protein NX059_002940 [Plenodomus lindquistii]|nr:hypothetical protein NX059_002940 [Plenodomus lindquistii]
MSVVTLMLALSSALASALTITAKTDGRGATIYTAPSLGGTAFAIPANEYCTNLNNVFADVDAKTRSIQTEKGYRCEFFLEYGCPESTPYLWLGSPSEPITLNALRSDYDNAIHSAYCTPVSPAAAADIGKTGVQYMAPAAFSKRAAKAGKTAAVLHTAVKQKGDALGVPADGVCYSLGALPNAIPDLSNKIQSFKVEKGFVCHFFSQPGCYSESLPYIGRAVDVLDEGLNGRIASVSCLPVS